MAEEQPPHLDKSHSENNMTNKPPEQREDLKANGHNQLKSIEQFALGEKLGEGTFGTVRLATHIETKEEVAIKILEKLKILQLEDKTRVEREIKILKYLRHNNIAQLYSVIQTNENICLVIEYVKGKELFDYIIENKHLSEQEACCFYQQIISGIEYLHKLRVVHRDLKPENLLIDTKNTIKIVDFGLSIDYGEDELLSTACGSPCYAAPEMLVGKKYVATGVDIWSSGIVLYAMLTGYLPFDDNDNDALYKKITQGRFAMPENISEAAKDLIRRILTTDPQNRISIYQIKRHPWFNSSSPKLTVSQGLLLNLNVIPIDEELVDKMASIGYNKEEVRANVLSNRHNHITTSYYLFLRKMLKEGRTSVADLKSDKFVEYAKDRKNLFSNYNNDFKKVINARAALPEYINTKTEVANAIVTKHKRYMSMTVSAESKDKNMKKTQGSADVVGFRTNSFRKKIDIPNSYCDDRVKAKDNSKTITETREETIKAPNNVKASVNKSFNAKNNKHKVSYSLDMNPDFKTHKLYSKKPNRALYIKATHLATTANSNDDKEHLNTTQGMNCKYNKSISSSKKYSIMNTHYKTDAFATNTDKFKAKTRKEPIAQYRQNLKQASPPFDLCCLSFKPLSELKEKIAKTLLKRRIKYRIPKNAFLCETKHMQFSVELVRNCDVVNAYIVQLKRIEGPEDTYRTVSANLIETLSL